MAERKAVPATAASRLPDTLLLIAAISLVVFVLGYLFEPGQFETEIVTRADGGIGSGWQYLLSDTPSTAAGKKVDADTAQNLAAVLACLRVLTETVSSLPLIVYRRDGEFRHRATEHPLYSLFHDSPNPLTTSMRGREWHTGR